MRKIVLALLIALLPAAALAQSAAPPNLPYHSLWGRLGATPGDTGPGEAIPFASLQALLGPVFGPATSTTGHIVLFGNTIGTLLTDGGAISALWTNGLGIMPCANFPALTGSVTTSAGSCVTTFFYTSPLTGGTQMTLTAKLSESVSIYDFGAHGDCVNDDTPAFVAAHNSGAARIHIPATANCYLVTKVNGTAHNNITWEGDGDQSLIKINGSDANGNWWDLTASNNVTFKNLKFIDNGSAVRIAFLWACTGTSCLTSGTVSGLIFDHVNVNAKFTLAGLYAYGFTILATPSVPTVPTGAGALAMTNGTWINTNNGSLGASPNTRTSVINLTAFNAGAVRSVYQTLTTSTATATQAYFANFSAVDGATTGSTLSNNAAMVTDGANQFTMLGGSLQCLCQADFIGWTSDEGITFIQTGFEEPFGVVACKTLFWLEFGGGLNGVINLQSPFLSCNGVGGGYIGLDGGVSATNGGIEGLTVMSNDPGLNTNSVPFINTTGIVGGSCGSFTVTNNWIFNSNIQLLTGANNIFTCGSIDAKSFIQNAGTITVPSGATDHGSANPFR